MRRTRITCRDLAVRRDGSASRRSKALLCRWAFHDRLAKPEAGKLIAEAAAGIGLEPRQVTAAWQAASGFAHGRYWPNLRASLPRDAARGGSDHYLMALVIDESQHRPLTDHTHALLRHVQARYTARATTP
jgi:hypothetical protein